MYNKSVVAISKFPSTMEDCLTNIPTVCVEKTDWSFLFQLQYLFIFLYLTGAEVTRTKEKIIMREHVI